ncbi:4-phosphopantoate--beta-alanine ligase [Pararhodobacter oceanensis]|uniref:4-phosphopantoate--beta-alanine ligase n=1 Tax=Pararhodobacter oceanensis TaxID=2172121 RepID=UPI003A8E859E
MYVTRSIQDIRAQSAGFRTQGESVALVPLSRGLHAGHLALIAQAKAECSRVIASLTGPPDTQTTAQLQASDVDAVFVPDPAEFAPADAQTIVEPVTLGKSLLGRYFPKHFRARSTEVTRLLNIIQPDAACFGEKDFQELAAIRQTCRDLHIPVRIIATATLRDSDGLALSLRNQALVPADRTAALCLNRALTQAEAMAKTGITASRLRAWTAAHIQSEPRADLQSADIRCADTLHTISGPLTAPAVILLAVRFGRTLLLDHRVVTPADPGDDLAAGQDGLTPAQHRPKPSQRPDRPPLYAANILGVNAPRA